MRRAMRLILPAALLALAACAPIVTVHGYVPPEDELAEIKPGTDTMATVEERIGRPVSTSLLGDREWYYVQSTMEQFAYNPPEITDRTLVAIAFSDSGVVTDVQTYGLEDGRVVNLSPRVTPTGAKRAGSLQRFFAGLLNFNAESVVDN